MTYSRVGRGLALALAMILMALTVAACDSDSDAAVVTTEAATVSSTEVEASSDSDDVQTSDASPTDPVDETQAVPARAESDGHLAAQLDEIPPAELSEQEAADILWMREEEKVARDVYLTLGELWDVRVFTNIAGAEDMHMSSMLELIDRYDLEDPVGDNAAGVFTNPDIQALYDSLVAEGSQSLEDALIVGATIEDLDIFDLQVATAATDNEDIALVYANLEMGSRNHMRAFYRQLDKNDVDYEPAYISQAEYDSIISSASERGNA
ncbi:MAG: DUF2202 domain-containing protein [Actinomycetota bacterium]|nr:DUF2202 domain-containing protein [Actinomycetota bacterium]